MRHGWWGGGGMLILSAVAKSSATGSRKAKRFGLQANGSLRGRCNPQSSGVPDNAECGVTPPMGQYAFILFVLFVLQLASVCDGVAHPSSIVLPTHGLG